jgi:Type IX secretion system protein PorV
MKKVLFILAILTLAGSSLADISKVGSAGAQFLKIGVGSRYQGMGETGVATTNDAYAMYWNPAGLASVDGSAVSFTNVNWFLDVGLNYVGYAHNFEDVGVFGVSATILTMGNVEVTTFEQQEGTGDFYSASSYALGFSFARQLTNKFAFGTTVKYVGERISNLRSSSIAFDFGTQLETGFRSLKLGMSITNMGADLKFEGSDLDFLVGADQNNSVNAQLKSTPYDLPMMFRMGMSYDIQVSEKANFTVAGDLRHPNDNIQQMGLGVEFDYSERFFIRAGQKFNYEEEGLSFGGGIATKLTDATKLMVDYAWQDFGRLGSVQRFSVGFGF